MRTVLFLDLRFHTFKNTDGRLTRTVKDWKRWFDSSSIPPTMLNYFYVLEVRAKKLPTLTRLKRKSRKVAKSSELLVPNLCLVQQTSGTWNPLRPEGNNCGVAVALCWWDPKLPTSKYWPAVGFVSPTRISLHRSSARPSLGYPGFNYIGGYWAMACGLQGNQDHSQYALLLSLRIRSIGTTANAGLPKRVYGEAHIHKVYWLPRIAGDHYINPIAPYSHWEK